mgnify:CR=1 FL=1
MPDRKGQNKAPVRENDRPRRRGGAGERRCLLLGQPRPRDALIRFVLDPDNRVIPDLGERLPGRGIWLSADAGALNKATKKNLFRRATKGAAIVPADLPQKVVMGLEDRCLDTLGLARRAGQLRLGYERIADALDRGGGEGGVVVRAADSGGHDAARLRRRIGPATVWAEHFSGAQLAAAIGRPGSIASLYIAPGALADRFAADYRRLRGLVADALQETPKGEHEHEIEPTARIE